MGLGASRAPARGGGSPAGGGNGGGAVLSEAFGGSGAADAVNLALKWLAEHQRADGSWPWYLPKPKPRHRKKRRATFVIEGQRRGRDGPALRRQARPVLTGKKSGKGSRRDDDDSGKGRPRGPGPVFPWKLPSPTKCLGKRMKHGLRLPSLGGGVTKPSGTSRQGLPSMSQRTLTLRRPKSGDGRGGDEPSSKRGGSGEMEVKPARRVKVDEVDPRELAATSMAALAFLGAGHTQHRGEYREVVHRALEWIARNQKADGSWRNPSWAQEMHSQGLATLALVEGYVSAPVGKNSLRFRRSAQKGLDFIAGHRVGSWAWGYRAKDVKVEQSATFWNAMALLSAKHPGLRRDPVALDSLARWLDRSRGRDGQHARCAALAGGRPLVRERRSSPCSNAAALAMRRMMRGAAADERELKTADLVVAGLKERWNAGAYANAGREDIYFLFHGTAALWRLGGDRWKKWNREMRTGLLDAQLGAGNWPAGGLYLDSEVAATATGVLTLECYRQRLGIYR
jgi:hypothetical protein